MSAIVSQHKIEEAVSNLSLALRTDNELAIGWHANIAMPIYVGANGKLNPLEANAIADSIMEHLFQAKAVYPS